MSGTNFVLSINELIAKYLKGSRGRQLKVEPSLQPIERADKPQEKIIAREYDGSDRVDYAIKDSTVITYKDKRNEPEYTKNIKEKIKSLFFPEAFPQSVSPEYLKYRKWEGISNALNSAINYFSTQTLLTALGIAFPVPAAAAMAWMLKDSLSGVGKFLGGYISHKVDQEPKKWNIVGDTLNITGSYISHALALAPGAFLPVAIASQALKGTGETLCGAAQANIEKHLAIADNIGELKTKNANQDMLTSGIGVGFAVGLQFLASLTGIGTMGLVAIYAGLTAANIAATYKASKTLKMDYPNIKNLHRIFSNHIETKKIMSPKEFDNAESFIDMIKGVFSKDVVLGAGVKDLSGKPELFREITTLFADKNYLLYRDKDKTKIVLRPQADRKDVAEALYCASLLEKNLVSPEFEKKKSGMDTATLEAIKTSVKEMPAIDTTLKELEQAGWNTSKIPLPLGKRADWGNLEDTH